MSAFFSSEPSLKDKILLILPDDSSGLTYQDLLKVFPDKTETALRTALKSLQRWKEVGVSYEGKSQTAYWRRVK